MKKLLVVILICLSACKQEKPTDKAKEVVIHYLDSTGHHSFVVNVNRNFTQRKKYLFGCDYPDTSSGPPCPGTAYFTLDSTLSKVERVEVIIH